MQLPKVPPETELEVLGTGDRGKLGVADFGIDRVLVVPLVLLLWGTRSGICDVGGGSRMTPRFGEEFGRLVIVEFGTIRVPVNAIAACPTVVFEGSIPGLCDMMELVLVALYC